MIYNNYTKTTLRYSDEVVLVLPDDKDVVT